MATAQRMSIDESHCVLCCEDMEYSACGSCDHPICLKCCVKLRLLRKEYDCPVCRAQLKEVIVSKGYKSWADKSTKPRRQQHARNYGILHETPESQAKVDELLEHRCSECNELFRLFPQVKDHNRKAHSLMYCDICLRHLKIFTHERKCYTREALVRHRKEGDADDRSHRGHPLCQFCDERYLDNDELLVHLRKNHFWCHICEKDGNQDYYPNYKGLRKHFKQEHFLCEEGECFHDKFTSVFRMKVDYQAHIAQKHSDRLSKAEARQMRQLDVNITFAPREDSDSIVFARDYSFPEQGHERYRERSRMTSSATGRDFQFCESRDPGRYKAKDKDRKKETQSSQDPKTRVSPERYRQTDMKVMETEDHKGMKMSKMRSPKEVLEGDNKRPPGDNKRPPGDNKRPPGDNKRPPGDNKRPPGCIVQEEMGNRKIFDSNGSKSSNTEKKSGKREADYVKSKKDSSKKKELSGESLVSGKEKKQSLDEGGFSGKEKNNGNLSKTKIQESNEGSSDQKADSKSKTKNNNLTQEKNADPSLPQSGVRQEKNTGPSSSSVVHSASNLEDDFPALSTDKKQGPAANIAKRKPTYDSEFPSLSNESSKANPSIRPPPGQSAPPGFSGKLVKPKPNQRDPAEVDFESGQKFEQFSDLYKANPRSKQAQKETLNPEKALANKSASKSSVPKKLAPKPTYDTEFPTLSTLTNGHKASSAIKAPPGLAPPGFQPGIPVRPPPGLGWSVPLKGSSAKETRNQKLINDIRRILNLRGESFEKFREVSGFYRQGKSSPREYYQECCELLGEDHIHKVFRELIDLLPDEDKQRQLLLVYNDAKVKSKLEDNVKGKEESDFKFSTEKAVATEKVVTGNNDMSASQPPLEDDFPALSKAAGKKSKSAEKISSAWTRGR